MTAALKLVKDDLPTWDEVREAYSKMRQMGWQSVQQAARVGAMLIELKKGSDRIGPGNFRKRAEVEMRGASADTVERLMLLHRFLPLLERHKPESQAKALALIPKKRPKQPTVEELVERDRKRREREEEEERPKTEEDHRASYWARVWNARQWALEGFSGKKPDHDMVAEARACAAAWEEVARQLEEKLQCQ